MTIRLLALITFILLVLLALAPAGFLLTHLLP